MNLTRGLTAAGALFLAGALPAGDDYSALVEDAVTALDSGYHEEWAFTETKLEDEKLWVGRFDPSRPKNERWSLLSVDGRDPSDDEIDDYLGDQDDPSGGDESSVSAMIEPGSVRLIEETDDFWRFAFVPSDDDEAFLRNVDSTLRIMKDGRYLAEIELVAQRPFKPGFGVKFDEFLTRLTFAPVADGGPIAPRTVDVKVKGRAVLVFRFDETTALAYSDFEHVGN